MLIVVMYHEVSEIIPPLLSESVCTEEERFEKHLQFYNEYFCPVGFESLFSHSTETKILLTFDDGYVGNYRYVFPLLKKYETPGLFFLTTGIIDRTCTSWVLLLKYLEQTYIKVFAAWRAHPLLVPFVFNRGLCSAGKRFFRYSYIDRLNRYIAKHPAIKEQIQKMFMSWSEVQEMSQNDLITFGSHTLSHPILSNLTYKNQHLEIVNSAKALDAKLNRTTRSFAVPFGKKEHFNDDTIQILQRNKLLNFTTIPGVNESDCTGSYYRIGIHNESVDQLKDKILRYL